MLTLRKLLLIVAVIFFFLVGVGIGSFAIGTFRLDLLGFGLAFFAGSFLVD